MWFLFTLRVSRLTWILHTGVGERLRLPREASDLDERDDDDEEEEDLDESDDDEEEERDEGEEEEDELDEVDEDLDVDLDLDLLDDLSRLLLLGLRAIIRWLSN